MDTAAQRFGHVLDEVAELAAIFDLPAAERERRWLLGKTQVLMIQLEGLEARLARTPINGTPQPKTPAPRPTPRPQPRPQPKPTPPPDKGGQK